MSLNDRLSIYLRTDTISAKKKKRSMNGALNAILLYASAASIRRAASSMRSRLVARLKRAKVLASPLNQSP